MDMGILQHIQDEKDCIYALGDEHVTELLPWESREKRMSTPVTGILALHDGLCSLAPAMISRRTAVALG